jgi:hypothetical protein
MNNEGLANVSAANLFQTSFARGGDTFGQPNASDVVRLDRVKSFGPCCGMSLQIVILPGSDESLYEALV